MLFSEIVKSSTQKTFGKTVEHLLWSSWKLCDFDEKDSTVRVVFTNTEQSLAKFRAAVAFRTAFEGESISIRILEDSSSCE